VYVEEQARLQVAAGYDAMAEIVASLIEAVDEDDELDATTDEVTAAVRSAWQERLAEQESWPAETDVDRLLRAFAALDRDGVLARDHFTCCQRCGHDEIGGAVPAGQRRDGYTFFHQQDTERAASGGPLYLAYGAFGGPDLASNHPAGDDPAGDEAIGRRVVKALEAERLSVEWDGTSASRIAVHLAWHRRLPA